MTRYATLLLALGLSGCSDFPSFGTPDPGFGDWSTFPRIEPIDGLIIRALGPTTGNGRVAQPLADITDPLEARIAALIARAAILRGAPVNDTTRSLISGQ